MELQLGLALPVPSPALKGFDLNTLLSDGDLYGRECSRGKGKRVYDEALGEHFPSPAKLVADLLVWHGRDDDGKGRKKKQESCTIHKIERVEENYIIGWPPIKSSRKRELLQRRHGPRGRNVRAEFRRKPTAGARDNRSTSNNSTFVKVKMEGVAIARKVDLSVHSSYHTLNHTLLAMFIDYDQGMEECKHYKLAYQDKEGDWLLAGDVPWKSFVQCVQRLEIVRN